MKQVVDRYECQRCERVQEVDHDKAPDGMLYLWVRKAPGWHTGTTFEATRRPGFIDPRIPHEVMICLACSSDLTDFLKITEPALATS